MNTSCHSYDLSNKTILVVEDDFDIGDILERYLKKENMHVIRAIQGQQALELLKVHAIDLVILDIKLPKKNGWEVLTVLRQYSNVPVIMLTAMDDFDNKIMALKMGADDFVVKPFNPNEVIARVEAVLRRSTIQQEQKKYLNYKSIEMNLEQHLVYVLHHDQKQLLNLTLTEFNILKLMLQSPNKVFTRSELIEKCMPEKTTLDRTVDSHISNLRKKLEQKGALGYFINLRGVGYRLDQNHDN
ncbi:efflux system response regulator transcription factor AdeR [Acinetobacter gerneri]|uniref:efflux system response regulator transcription factor AdeR n=1 Tax=Acinetobacter gerneri TaxID=202952 RepID=UPI003AF55ACD